MKPDNLKIINELVYEKQQLKLCPEGIAKSIEQQLEFVVSQIDDVEPPILYYDDEGQPIHGVTGYASDDEVMPWDEIIDRGLF